MLEALHLGTVGLAAVGACCTAAAKSRGKTLNMITAPIMLLAMADTALHLSTIPGAGWAAIMLVVVLSAGAALYAAASGWMALRCHGSPRSNRIEAAAMGLSVVIMSLTGIG